MFLDGIGLGQPGPDNPFTPGEGGEPMPFLAGRLGGRGLLAGADISGPDLLLKGIDASLGVPGRPQSATGQTALYTGRNAPAFINRHLTGFANGSLRILLEESSLFKQALALGKSATSANLYTPGYFQAIEDRRIRYSVGALMNMTAGVPFRMPEDYERGEALFWDITNRYSYRRDYPLTLIAPQEAGQRLARISHKYDVTLYECYLPDFAGHRTDLALAREVLLEVDGLVQGALENMDSQTSLVVTSDHGNVEDLSTRLHTHNPVPLLVIGPAAPLFGQVKDIMGVTPAIIQALQE